MHDLAPVVGEVLQRREAPGLGMQVHEPEAPTAMLMTPVLADEAIEPTFQSTGQIEIRAINGQHERFV